ncbi:MAG TPA: SxtJ family membrane protein [Gemmataceae bacterium]|jgi:hypothetical protein|nr:SxtJ family membrane protein [Gemmataceae bacterium]
MRWTDISFQPASRTLRQFAGLWLLFFGGWAGWLGLVKGQETWGIALGAIALGIGIVGLVTPQKIRLVFVAWMVLAFPIGWTVTHILLALTFYGIFMPMGFVFKWMGRDLLQRRKRSHTETYWTPKPAAKDARAYFRQF